MKYRVLLPADYDSSVRPVFAAAGGFSSALRVTDPALGDGMPSYRDQINTIYGPAGSDTRAASDILLIAGKARPESAPSLYVDCATSEGLLESNRRLARPRVDKPRVDKPRVDTPRTNTDKHG